MQDETDAVAVHVCHRPSASMRRLQTDAVEGLEGPGHITMLFVGAPSKKLSRYSVAFRV